MTKTEWMKYGEGQKWLAGLSVAPDNENAVLSSGTYSDPSTGVDYHYSFDPPEGLIAVTATGLYSPGTPELDAERSRLADKIL